MISKKLWIVSVLYVVSESTIIWKKFLYDDTIKLLNCDILLENFRTKVYYFTWKF